MVSNFLYCTREKITKYLIIIGVTSSQSSIKFTEHCWADKAHIKAQPFHSPTKETSLSQLYHFRIICKSPKTGLLLPFVGSSQRQLPINCSLFSGDSLSPLDLCFLGFHYHIYITYLILTVSFEFNLRATLYWLCKSLRLFPTASIRAVNVVCV